MTWEAEQAGSELRSDMTRSPGPPWLVVKVRMEAGGQLRRLFQCFRREVMVAKTREVACGS